jgi:Xaa-Pro aminopeptidase
MTRFTRVLLLLASVVFCAATVGAQPTPERPFGTLREQAAMQQDWLKKRLDTFLPALMRKHGMDMWIVPMREYNEDPVFVALAAPQTFAARRRTIYVFFDKCAAAGAPVTAACVERIALGGSSQGGVFTVLRAEGMAPAGAQRAELWGDEQWRLLRLIVEQRKPRRIAVNTSRVFAFSDGITAGEHEALLEALGRQRRKRVVAAERLAVDLLAVRLPGEAEVFADMVKLNWALIDTMFSSKAVVPGTTRPSDLVWWFRQRVSDLGLGTWFQPSVTVQRQGAGADELGDDPIIQRGDVLHCDVGITVLGLNTDIQHMGYVLRPGESDAPAGLKAALARSNRLQDIVLAELRPGRSGNEILAAARARMVAEGIDGSIYSHPIGLHGHGAGPLIGLWDRQEGVPGRGDHRVIPDTWFSIELQVAAPAPEWGGQPVRSAQEEDVILGADGVPAWAWRRQTEYHLVR